MSLLKKHASHLERTHKALHKQGLKGLVVVYSFGQSENAKRRTTTNKIGEAVNAQW